MTQLRIKELLSRANDRLDKGLHILPGFVVIKSSEMEALLDRINASIPEDIKEAESILRRRDELQIEAQQRAERIIIDARNEAEKILSESELLNQVHKEAEKIKEQVLNECQDLRDKTVDEAKVTKIKAEDEAARIREGAENYAEQILNNIDTDLAQLQQIVQNGKLYLSQLKSTHSPQTTAYVQDANEYNKQNTLEDFDSNYVL